MELKNIAILGPGGNVGTAILHELLKPSSSPPPSTLTLITRPTSTYTPPTNATTTTTTIIHKTVDYTSFSSLQSAFTNQDAIVNCVTGSATQYDASHLIITAAVAAGVKFFFANEFVGDIQRLAYTRLPEQFVGAKVRIRAELQELARQGKICWTSLNTGPFFDMWLMKGPAGLSISTSQARIYGTGDTPLYWTPLPVVARAAVSMLRNPLAVMNRAIHICPFVTQRGAPSTLTQRKLLHALEAELGQTFSVEHVDVERIFKCALSVLASYERGAPGGERIAQAVKGLAVCNQFYDEHEDDVGGLGFSQLVENEVVGVETIDLADAVRDAVQRYGRDCAVVEGMFNVEACEV